MVSPKISFEICCGKPFACTKEEPSKAIANIERSKRLGIAINFFYTKLIFPDRTENRVKYQLITKKDEENFSLNEQKAFFIVFNITVNFQDDRVFGIRTKKPDNVA
jgi:hypothetical protein